MKIRWGIIGLGKIAHTFADDLKTVEDAEIFAVASRSQSKANEFAKKYHVKYAYGNYSELFKNKDINVVYIATPHVFHHKNTIEALEHKKAVLCEKPLAMNAKQVQEMQALAQKNKVFFMEALWTNFMPAIKFLNDINLNKTYGKLKHLKAEFCFKPQFDAKSRLFNKSLGGGALLDIGIYPVYLALKMLGKPDDIEAKAQFNETDVDVETRIHFLYKNGAKADLFCSLNQTTNSEAILEYDQAKITMHKRFHETDKLSISTKDTEKIKDFNHKHRGYNFEIEHVNQCLLKDLKESPIMSFAFSLLLIETLDKIREIIGLEYN